MSVTLAASLSLTVTEVLESNVGYAAGDKSIIHSLAELLDGIVGHTSMGASTSPPASKVAAYDVTLSTGAATIDLTALPQAGGGTQSVNGLLARYLVFVNPVSNANNITIADGASNGYLVFGDASGQITLKPGQFCILFCAGNAQTVGGSNKTIDITGTGSQVLRMLALFGS
jgi:hypothetical protein